MSKVKPIKIMTLDTETYNGLIGGLKRIAVYDGNNVVYGYHFSDVEKELIKWHDDGYIVYCYIHNMEFDLRKIPEVMKKDSVLWSKCFVINGKIARVATKEYYLQDSLKLLPMSLKKLSHDFDVEHGKLDLWEEVQKQYGNEYQDIVDYLDRCDIDDELYLRYLGYDVISLYEVIKKLIEVSGLSEKEFTKIMTTASLSRYIFKNGYKGKVFKHLNNMKTDYQIMTMYNWNQNNEVEEFLRCGYCGGRTEVFKIELNKNGYHYDFNSLYPYEMLKDYPVGKPEFFHDAETSEYLFTSWMKNHDGLGFLSCLVNIPLQNIPPLPSKMGKLVFPTGVIYGTWTFTELEYAIEHCGVEIQEYYEVCYFRKTFKVFETFVKEMNEIKLLGEETHNLSLRTLGKLLMNVGYGYTGMSREKSSIDSIKNITKYGDEQILSINEELGYIEISQNVKAEYIQVQIAAYVTSYARIELLNALLNAEKNGSVYYCDTDSIVTDAEIDFSIVHPTKLGALKLESKPVKGLFLRPKVYAEVFETDEEKAEKILNSNYKMRNNFLKTDNKIYEVEKRFKGVSRDTQTIMSFYDYENLLKELQEETKSYTIVERNKLQLRSIMYMQKKGLDADYYEIRDKKMNLDTKEKRIMDYNKNQTVPHHFASVEEFERFSFAKNSIVNIDT